MEAVWIFLPLLGAFIAHAPVLRFDLLRALARPIDGGATFRGKRIFGDNKTWRGVLVMTIGVIALTAVLERVPWYWSKLPAAIQRAGALRFGSLLGLGAVVGELPNSFLKRQFGIAAGAQRRSLLGFVMIVLDQGDFVLGAWLFLAPVWPMPLRVGLAAFGIVVAVHLIINVIGYAIGARKTWL